MERQYRVAYRMESSKVKKYVKINADTVVDAVNKLIEVGIIDGVEYVASVNEI